jgi:hypothetical protein
LCEYVKVVGDAKGTNTSLAFQYFKGLLKRKVPNHGGSNADAGNWGWSERLGRSSVKGKNCG